MKKIKYLLIAFIGILLISSASYGQVPIVNVKYNAEIYGNPANKVYITVTVWIPGFPNTIEDATTTVLPACAPGGSSVLPTPSCYTGYDIYGVQILDNSGGGNDGWAGETWGTTDDFNYKPFTSVLHYNVTYYTGGANSADILIH